MALPDSSQDVNNKIAQEPAQPSIWQLIKEDWSYNRKDWRYAGFRALAVYRFGEWVYGLRSKIAHRVLRKIYGALFRYVRNHYGIEIVRGAKIGRCVVIGHHFGVVIGANTEIGDRCLIRHNVTIGAVSNDQTKLKPKIGEGVQIGAGAQIIGNVTVGEGARIGSNAVVTTDIPAHAIVFVEKPKIILLPEAMRKARAGIRHADKQIGLDRAGKV